MKLFLDMLFLITLDILKTGFILPILYRKTGFINKLSHNRPVITSVIEGPQYISFREK